MLASLLHLSFFSSVKDASLSTTKKSFKLAILFPLTTAGNANATTTHKAVTTSARTTRSLTTFLGAAVECATTAKTIQLVRGEIMLSNIYFPLAGRGGDTKVQKQRESILALEIVFGNITVFSLNICDIHHLHHTVNVKN